MSKKFNYHTLLESAILFGYALKSRTLKMKQPHESLTKVLETISKKSMTLIFDFKISQPMTAIVTHNVFHVHILSPYVYNTFDCDPYLKIQFCSVMSTNNTKL